MERLRVVTIVAILVFSAMPVSGIDSTPPKAEYLSEIPTVKENYWEELPWWKTTPRDLNRNGIVDWLETIESDYPIDNIGFRISERFLKMIENTNYCINKSDACNQEEFLLNKIYKNRFIILKK